MLDRVSPLELLVEVGFDKLIRDYIHAFLGMFCCVVLSDAVLLSCMRILVLNNCGDD